MLYKRRGFFILTLLLPVNRASGSLAEEWAGRQGVDIGTSGGLQWRDGQLKSPAKYRGFCWRVDFGDIGDFGWQVSLPYVERSGTRLALDGLDC